MANSSVADDGLPVPNLRVTFWGVQGSCPIFPTQEEVAEYARQIATHTLQRSLSDLAEKLERGQLTPRILRELAAMEPAADYQRQLGLPPLPTYGGDTTCIQVQTAEGNTIVFDMGTGLRDFSKHATANWGQRDRTLHVFASHEHLDHRSGLPFSSFCFEKQNPFTVHVYSTRRFLTALDERYGIFSHELSPVAHVDDPLDFRRLSAIFTGTEIQIPNAPPDDFALTWPLRHVGRPIAIGATTITPFEVYHGITHCLAYKVRHGNSTFVFCTDHELRHGDSPNDPRQLRSLAAEQEVVRQCQNADVAYFDGQYFLAEYLGQKGIGSGPGVSRIDWGHGCIEDIIERVSACQIKRTFIGHHDPERLWGQRVELDRQLKEVCEGKPFHIELAKAGKTIDI